MRRFSMEHYHKFFNPHSIAIIGASGKTGPGSYNLMENLMKEAIVPPGCTR